MLRRLSDQSNNSSRQFMDQMIYRRKHFSKGKHSLDTTVKSTLYTHYLQRVIWSMTEFWYLSRKGVSVVRQKSVYLHNLFLDSTCFNWLGQKEHLPFKQGWILPLSEIFLVLDFQNFIFAQFHINNLFSKRSCTSFQHC